MLTFSLFSIKKQYVNQTAYCKLFLTRYSIQQLQDKTAAAESLNV